MPMIRTLLVLLALSALGGCAIGQKLDYRQVAPQLSAHSGTPVQVTVIDTRPYVQSGAEKPDYVGTLRGLYYNPFNVTTYSGAPLAADINIAIRNALLRAPINPLVSQHGSTAGPKQLIIRLDEWKSDTYMRIRFDYDITATVRDEHGRELASQRARHSGKIDHFLDAGTAALTEVLNAPDIVSALAAPPRP